MQIKFENPKMKQSKTADQLRFSSSNLQRYKNDIKMLSPYGVQPNNTNKRTQKLSSTKFDNNSHREHDLKRPKMTSNDVAKPETNTKSNKRNKNVLKVGSVHENIEINDEYLDENLQNINP